MIQLKSLRQSVFTSVGLLVLSILILVLVSLFYYLTFNQVSSSNQSATVTAQLTAQSVMDKTDRNFYERFGDVQAFAFNQLAVATAEKDSIAAGAQQFINTMTAYYVLYDLMMICNREGKVLAVNTKDKNGKVIPTHPFLSKNVSQEEWFRVCTSPEGPQGGAWFSDYSALEDIGKIYGTEGRGMAFAAPIRNAQGAIIGVWYNYASWEEVTEGIRKQAESDLNKNHTGAFIVMTKSDGKIISTDNDLLSKSALSISKDGAVAPWKEETSIPFSNLTYGTSASKGAYTFAGKNWITAAFIPKEAISWKIFFSARNLLAVSVCLLVVALVAIYVYIYFKKNIISRINLVRVLQQRLSEGEIVEVKESSDVDELGQMIKSLSSLAGNLKEKAAFADEISKGNLSTTLHDLHSKDILGHSLQNMSTQLQIAQEADAQRNWTAEGLAQIAVILRSAHSSEQLYSGIIKFAVTYVKANQGGLFFTREEGDTKKITLAACYAYEKKKFLEKELDFGQGLVGQCLLEKQTIYLTEIPAEYIRITSGLGGASPTSLIIVPLKSNDEIHGAIEIASFEKFHPHQVSFLEKLAESIAASINTIRQSEKTKFLLEEQQQQTEEMKSQEEEMRQNMEELSATQEEMLRKEKEYLDRIYQLELRLKTTEVFN